MSNEITRSKPREKFASRMGFILISAGCAIGLGNVWRFPYITGQYGGSAFVLMYLLFLLILGIPVLIMEFSVGRASQKSMARSYNVLEPKGSRWHYYKWFALLGNILLMAFYTTVAGWMLNYMYKSAKGSFVGLSPDAVANQFTGMLSNPGELIFWMIVVCAIGLFVVSLGVQKGVERITSVMMAALIVIMIVLVIRSVTLPGAKAGLLFYLTPNFGAIFGQGFGHGMTAVYAAMGQAFFTLSIGASGMAIFGSYIDKSHSLTKEALTVAGLDTFIAIMAGLIIFPACFAYNLDAGQGAGLIFVTLSTVFSQMWMGQLWGSLFFLFMSFAALSTVIGVFENIISFAMDQWHWERGKSTLIMGVILIAVSVPAPLGMSIWSNIQVPGIGSIDAVEDFFVSGNALPIGSLIYALFCTRKGGWGWDNFIAEANAGEGMKFPLWARGWVTYGVPFLIGIVIIMGYIPYIQKWIGA